MKRFILMTFALVALAAPQAKAQNKLTAITYNVSVPVQDTRDYIGNTSWRGVALDARQFNSPDKPTMIGLHFAWHVFNEKTSDLISLEGADIKGTQRRYINSFPMLVTAHWYTGARDEMQFFVGTGIGAYYIRQRFEIGVNSTDENNWHFGIAPEVGVQFPFGDTDGTVSVRYDYAFASGSSVQGDGQAYSYIRVAVGVAYERW